VVFEGGKLRGPTGDALPRPAARPAPRPPASGSPRATALYLHDLRPLLASAADARRSFVRELGGLMDDASRSTRRMIAQAAGAAGRDHAGYFRQLKVRLEDLSPPAGCQACHHAAQRWVDRHLEASLILAEVGRTGDLARLHETQRRLAAAREHARQLNSEYSRLVEELRQRVKAADRRPRPPR
jgi:hypothetical protein